MRKFRVILNILWFANKDALQGFMAMIGFCFLFAFIFCCLLLVPTYLIALVFNMLIFPSIAVVIIMYIILFFVCCIIIKIKNDIKNNKTLFY